MKPLSFAPIGQFCETGSGTTPSRARAQEFYGGSIPWVKSGELREGTILKTEEMVTEAALRATSLKRVPAGALLVAMYGATVGRVGMLGIEATTNQAVCHIVPDRSRADPRYLFHALVAKAPELVSRGVGGAQPNISQGTIKQTQVYLPGLYQQVRLAAILDQADALCRKHRVAQRHLRSLVASEFERRFSETKAGQPLGEVVADTLIGLVRGADDFGPDFTTPYVRMDSISSDGAYLPEKVQKTEANMGELSRFALVEGDLLFNTRNSRELVGKSAVYRGSGNVVFNNNIMRIRLKDGWNSRFVDAYLRSVKGSQGLEQRKSGTTNVWAVYWSKLQTLPLPAVGRDEQAEFGRFVDEVHARLVFGTKRQTYLDNLFTSLQHRAFRGEL